ncbi:MAG: O-antigen polymerase, partial [Candidatus Peregrinibacteria bacterium GW2011_GWE2_39_6]
YAFVVLIPAIYSAKFESVFTSPKIIILRIITLGIVMLWGLQIIAQRKLIIRKSPLNKWLVMYATILLLTTLYSSHKWVSLFGNQGAFLGLFTVLNLLFLVIVTLNFFQTKAEIKRFLVLSVWTAIVLSIFGLLQSQGLIGAESWNNDPTIRTFGTLGHSNHFGAYLGFHVFLLIGLILTEKKIIIRGLYGFSLLLMGYAILTTASRGALMAVIISGLILSIGWTWTRRKKILAYRKIIIFSSVLIILLGLIFHGPILTRFSRLAIVQRTQDTLQFVKEGHLPDRVSWWFSSLAMIQEKPVLGFGLSTFQDTYNLYRRTDYQVPGDEQDLFTPENAHMEYLDLAATVGLLGLIIYLGFLGCSALLIFKVLRKKDNYAKVKITAISLFSAGMVYLTQVLFSFGTIGTLTPFYLLIGISGAFYHLTTDPKTPENQFKIIKIKGLALASWSIVILFLTLMSLWFTYRQAAAEYFANQGDEAKAGKQVETMLEAYNKATVYMPWMYRYFELYGQGAFDFGTYPNKDLKIEQYLLKTAITKYQMAYNLCKTQPDIAANLALAEIAYADLLNRMGAKSDAAIWQNSALQNYREAVSIGVNNPRFSYNLGKLLLLVHDQEAARDQFLSVLKIRDPYSDTYFQIALIATNLKDYELARLYLQKALLQSPGDPDGKALLQRLNSETSP